MPTLGQKKKEVQPKVEPVTEDLPQLTNEMQLIIMNKVKSGELSIEEAVNCARMDREQLKQRSSKEDIACDNKQEPSQHNFSVHKNSRYRWQKRVLQIDFNTSMLCNIEKGIVKRQFPFSAVKSCDDGVGSRFSISFKGHHDYELEAMSLEDKNEIMRLVNQIIYGNIYQDPEGDNTETHSQPQARQSLREGLLLLHRGGLASFKWVKYEAQLQPGQLTLYRRRPPSDAEVSPAVSAPIVVHLSHGDTSVEKSSSLDMFTLVTHKNQYQFKVPKPEKASAVVSVQKERDAWVRAIHTLCKDWKRKSMCEQMFLEPQSLWEIKIDEDIEDRSADHEGSDKSCDANIAHPAADNKNVAPNDGNHLSAEDKSPSPSFFPGPTPRMKTQTQAADWAIKPPVSSSTPPSADAPPISPSPPSPSPGPSAVVTALAPPEEAPTPVTKPEAPFIPPPPPLSFKPKTAFQKPRTKAFHWDVVKSEKIAKSLWKQEKSKGIVIDTTRLYEQFAVKAAGSFAVHEPNHTQHIMLNEKIAHNFSIFLKSFPVLPGELKDKLYVISVEDGGLSDEHITSLRRYVPTVEDVEMYKSHKGPVAELHIVDQYMLAMCNIPYLSTQLDLLLTLRELPISMKDLQPLINQKIRMCTQLYNCRSFVSVLEYLLAIGNYLNENAGKEKAKGFRLSSLTKLSQLRGTDRKFTLSHALVEQIMLHEPCLATFPQELTEFETVPGASVKGLTAEVDVLKNELQKVILYKKMSKKRSAEAPPPTFSKDLKAVIDKYKADLSALTETCEEMKKLYSSILVKFGEAADQDSQELFGQICQFIQEFRRSSAEWKTL